MTRERKREEEAQRGQESRRRRQRRRVAGGVVKAWCWAASGGEAPRNRAVPSEEDEDAELVGNYRSVFLQNTRCVI
jgi:hypothetical protein